MNTNSGKPRQEFLLNAFLLRQIENDINACFLFVAVARRAFDELRLSDGDAALGKASGNLREAMAHVSSSPVTRIREMNCLVRQLSSEVDGLLESRISKVA